MVDGLSWMITLTKKPALDVMQRTSGVRQLQGRRSSCRARSCFEVETKCTFEKSARRQQNAAEISLPCVVVHKWGSTKASCHFCNRNLTRPGLELPGPPGSRAGLVLGPGLVAGGPGAWPRGWCPEAGLPLCLLTILTILTYYTYLLYLLYLLTRPKTNNWRK